MIKIQIALDPADLEKAVWLLGETKEYVDIIELGTPLLMEEGAHAVRKIREVCPDKEILADTKIMDAGAYEAELMFKAGADYCTVLGVSDTSTVKGTIESAEKYGKCVFVDMIEVKDEASRTKELEAAGMNAIAVHVGVDRQALGYTPLESLKEIKAASRSSVISVAGGISPQTAADYVKAGADILVVGGNIYNAEDPKKAARELREAIDKAERELS